MLEQHAWQFGRGRGECPVHGRNNEDDDDDNDGSVTHMDRFATERGSKTTGTLTGPPIRTIQDDDDNIDNGNKLSTLTRCLGGYAPFLSLGVSFAFVPRVGMFLQVP